MKNKLDKIKGALVGLAIGDALGVHLEFTKPGSFEPIKDYMDGNPYDIPKGYWTDDTSMALCMADSLIEKKGFDAEDIMKRFCEWQRKGYRSSIGRCFDIGNTTRHALMEYWRDPSKGPYRGLTDFTSSGNGSIMRLAPIAMFYHGDIIKTLFYAGESSKITHGSEECVEACRALSEILFNGFNTEIADSSDLYSLDIRHAPLKTKIKSVIHGSYCDKLDSEIKGSGYVVNSLESALWAYHNSSSFEDAVLKAVNLGDDADTTGAVCGQIAGAFYGYDAIPQHLKDGLYQHDVIVELAEKLYEASNKQ